MRTVHLLIALTALFACCRCSSPPELKRMHEVDTLADRAIDAKHFERYRAIAADLRAEKIGRAVDLLVGKIQASGETVPTKSVLSGLIGRAEEIEVESIDPKTGEKVTTKETVMVGGLLNAIERVDAKIAEKLAEWHDDPNLKIREQARESIAEWSNRPSMTPEQQDKLIGEAAAWAAALRKKED